MMTDTEPASETLCLRQFRGDVQYTKKTNMLVTGSVFYIKANLSHYRSGHTLMVPGG